MVVNTFRTPYSQRNGLDEQANLEDQVQAETLQNQEHIEQPINGGSTSDHRATEGRISSQSGNEGQDSDDTDAELLQPQRDAQIDLSVNGKVSAFATAR